MHPYKIPITALTPPESMKWGLELEVNFEPKDDANPEQYWYISRSLDDSSFHEFKNLATGDLWAMIWHPSY